MVKLSEVENISSVERLSVRASEKIHRRYGYVEYTENSISEHEAAIVRMLASIVVANFPVLKKSDQWFVMQHETASCTKTAIGLTDCFFVQRIETLVEEKGTVQVNYAGELTLAEGLNQKFENDELTPIMRYLEAHQSIWQKTLVTPGNTLN